MRNKQNDKLIDSFLEGDIHGLVESIDPDWNDHFIDVYDAFAFYRKHSPETILDAILEL